MIFPPIIPNVVPVLTFLKENWKQLLFAIFFLWVVVCALTHCRGLSPWDVREGTTTTIQIDKLNSREQILNQIISDYRDTIRLMDLRIDSFDVIIRLKDKQLKNIHNEVQLLSGDSVAIVAALNGIFAKKR